ncbi:putative oxidoreductase YcjS [mine drainage metagenome]|uniref:Putative oxidoreductase YcjS n=1 Tax=mine drainage metagenome TaxID=410659 RepID=A0A1J5SSL9_9ZZZZ
MKETNFAIIGCGRIAQRHAEHISKRGNLQAVCDIDESKAISLAEKYNSKCYTDLNKMLVEEKQLDVVAICTPNGLHAEHSILVLKSGVNVLCEKPLALTTIDCGEMIKAAESSNKRLFAIKQNRFNPPVAAIKKVISDGVLGRIYSIQLSCFWNRNEEYYKNSWKGTKLLDGGTLYTQFSHFIDLLYWMFGDVKHVNSYIKNFAHNGIIEFEDTGVVILEFLSGAIGTINYTVNSFQKNMEGSLTIFAENGTVKVGGQYLNELEYQNIKDFKIENLPEGNKPNNYGTYFGSMSNHDKVYDNLIEVLNNKASISASLFDGMKTVEIIEKIYKAANKL